MGLFFFGFMKMETNWVHEIRSKKGCLVCFCPTRGAAMLLAWTKSGYQVPTVGVGNGSWLGQPVEQKI